MVFFHMKFSEIRDKKVSKTYFANFSTLHLRSKRRSAPLAVNVGDPQGGILPYSERNSTFFVARQKRPKAIVHGMFAHEIFRNRG